MPKPPKYDSAFCVIARDLGIKGATYPQIAKALNVQPTDLLKWENSHPEMRAALTPAFEAALLRQVARHLNERQSARVATAIKFSEVVDEC